MTTSQIGSKLGVSMTVHVRLTSSLELKGLIEIECSPSPPSLFPPCKDPSPYIVMILGSLATLAFNLCYKVQRTPDFPGRTRAKNYTILREGSLSQLHHSATAV